MQAGRLHHKSKYFGALKGVIDSFSTRPSLLLRIRDSQDSLAWSEFVQLYAPMIYAFSRKRGLQDADAADITQEVLRSVARSAGRFEYAASRGGFRRWLFTVTRNEVNDHLTGARRVPGTNAETQTIDQLAAAAPDDAAEWDNEYEQRVLRWAAERIRKTVKESTWNAFWQTAVEGREPEEVARSLGMTVGAVYIAKSRVIARLRVEIEAQGGE
jgi:RNA polymerase sigma-70 factor (ECF subfamily)